MRPITRADRLRFARCEAGKLVDTWRVIVLSRAVRASFGVTMSWFISGMGSARPLPSSS